MSASLTKLLVVDDDRGIRDFVTVALKDGPYNITTVECGDDALPLLGDGYEIVLTDLDMPGNTNGAELTRRTRAETNADVIIMTGYPDLSSAIHAVREGAYDYLVKPLTPETLRMALERCVTRRRLSRELEREKALRAELKKAYEDLSRMEKVRDLFGQFATPEVAKFVMEHPSDFWKRGERREVTVLFADARRFTPFAARVPPEEAVRALNQIFEVLVGAVQEQGGAVNKFMGDGLMAIFGAPHVLPDHAAAAARAAVKARAMLQFLSSSEHPILQMGYALNTGEVLAGCVGAKGRTEYSVIGSAVNMAARIEKIAGPGEILLAPETAGRVAALFELENRPPISLAGFDEPVVLSALLDPKAGAFPAATAH